MYDQKKKKLENPKREFHSRRHSLRIYNSEIYNIGAHAQYLRVNHETMPTERVTFGLQQRISQTSNTTYETTFSTLY